MCVPHHTDCGELSRDFRLCTHQIKKVDKCFLSEQTKEQEKELMFIKLAKNFIELFIPLFRVKSTREDKIKIIGIHVPLSHFYSIHGITNIQDKSLNPEKCQVKT